MTSISQIAENTSVFILAAGRGERMRPLTDALPKPLLTVNGQSLLEHHLKRLKNFGFKNIVINIDHLGEKIINAMGDGQHLGLNICYSDEQATGALETAGGIHKALSLLKSNSFIVINGDVWCNFDYTQLLSCTQKLATIVLVENPAHNPAGDFSLNSNENSWSDAVAARKGEKSFTYSGIGIYQKKLFNNLNTGKHRLAPLLYQAAETKQLGAIICKEEWFDIGTPERLEKINRLVQHRIDSEHNSK